MAAAVKKIAVTEQTYYRWRKEYGGLKVDQAKRLKTLEQGLAREDRAVIHNVLRDAVPDFGGKVA